MASHTHWKNIRLGDVAKVISGFAFKSKDFQQEGIPIIKIKNIRVGAVDLSEVDYVDSSFLSLDSKYHVKGGDILISLTGSHLTQPNSVVGRVALQSLSLGHCLLNQRAGKIILTKPDICHKLFLFYSIYTEEKRREIALMALGAASQANVSPSQVESVEIKLPPLPIQRKIAAILSAYDRLIENNTRRIEILEEMARSIYREWFVKFRFPGHEQAQMVDSELGPIPEGWEIKKVNEIVKRLRTGTTYKEASVDEVGCVPVIDQSRSDFLGFHNNKPDHTASSENPIIIFGDHTCKMQLMVENFSLAPNVVPFVSIGNLPITYLYLLVNSLVTTTEYKRHWTEFTNKKVVLATNDSPKQFADFVKTIFEINNSLRKKNRNLRKTRDLLLPRLISGEIDVENLDIKTGETAA